MGPLFLDLFSWIRYRVVYMSVNLLIIVTKLVSFWIRLLGLGSGSTWPGEVALRMNRRFIRTMFNRNPSLKTVLVTGTNGKTTTSRLITHLLGQTGLRVITNDTGANLLNGIASMLLTGSTWNGRLPYDAVVIEVDENVLPLLLQDVEPNALVVLNLFRDQLDRYGEVNIVSVKWENAFTKLTKKTKLILNGNDPELLFLGEKASNAAVHYFGIPKAAMPETKLGTEADQIFCPRCSHRLDFSAIAYSHLGSYSCPHCGLAAPSTIFTMARPKTTQLLGLFNFYNLTAAVLTGTLVADLKPAEATKFLVAVAPAFGRQEQITVRDRTIILQLAKNPAGFHQAMSILDEIPGEKRVVLLLNDRIPDGRDVSWIWDVDFSPVVKVAKTIYLGGDRAEDLALRLEYQQGHSITFTQEDGFALGNNLVVNRSLSALIDRAIDETPAKATLVIFPTYSAMLEVRQILKGSSLNA